MSIPDIEIAPKVHPLIADLPPYLKAHENYEKVQRALYEAGASKCSHSDMLEWSNCHKCQKKQHNRAQMMRKLGFKSGQQYMAWRKVHEEIKNKHKKIFDALPKYNS